MPFHFTAAMSVGDQPELTLHSANGRVLQCTLEFYTSETGDDVDDLRRATFRKS